MMPATRWLPILLLLALACATSPPTMEFGPDADVTHDGLHRITHTRMQRVWLKPGVDFSGYSKILGINAGIHYKRSDRRQRNRFTIPEHVRERMKRDLTEAFESALARDGAWELVEDPGPEVLVVRGALIDVDVSAPPEPRSARETSIVRALGRATLIVELYDSESLEILGRVADRREVAHTGIKLNKVTNNRAATRQMFRQWAWRFRDGLDFARSVEWPAEPPAESASAS